LLIIPSIDSKSCYAERRPARRSRKPTRGVIGEFKASSPCPQIEQLLKAGGNIQIGRISPFDYVAVASDEDMTLAALPPPNARETSMKVIHRLDTTVDQVVNHDTLVDEINRP